MNSSESSALRERVRQQLPTIVARTNSALRGEGLEAIEPTLTRIGRGGRLAHWYDGLRTSGTLPNLDGKTIGSILEMILTGILETGVFAAEGLKLRINPARGVDLPDLELGIKTPSTNYCTSEPFFSAYERLYGSEYDVLVLLTDYQEGKSRPPLRIQITSYRYLFNSQVADAGLCQVARRHRDWLLARSEAWTKKIFRFLAYVNQSDWRARQLVKMISVLDDPARIQAAVAAAKHDFERVNLRRTRENKLPMPDTELQALDFVLEAKDTQLATIDAADNWVIESSGEVARTPNGNEWNRLLKSPLDGVIGMSFALQWRYNFGSIFRGAGEASAE